MDKLSEAREAIGQADKEIAALFEKRMQAVRTVAEYKRENGLPVFDSAREAERQTGIGYKLISRVCRGERNSTCGYVFKFV